MKTLLPVLLLAAAACASPSRAVRFGDRVRTHDDTCRPRVFLDGERPAKFLVLGRVEAESTQDMGGLRGALVKNACSLGATGLIDVSIETYDTVSSKFDEQTRESTIAKGPAIHAATALAVLVQDATVVKADSSSAEMPLCAPCPTCAQPAAAKAPTTVAPKSPTPVVESPAKSSAKVPRSEVPRAAVLPPTEELPPPPPPPMLDE